ncbi:hypothetical protein Agub_g2170 [Astrephomene gubernaculifera]|uniref:Histone deacetylase domain-containing protein n=1 Tax=Astrephomene gubernaculifera TaxID=47775 RepID=A0AAD3HHG7_9CHLO|nr:hypothetical protein Agub_g2170 [Astrephomene gubernaculifera]
MVSGSSINPLHLVFQHSASPYDPEFATTAAACPASPHPRDRKRAAPTSPQRNSVVCAVLPSTTALNERAVSPSSSTISAPGAGATPMTERLALGRFSASTPAFGAQGMSPLDPLADTRGHNGLYASRSPFEHPSNVQEATVALLSDDNNQVAAASHVEFSAAPTPAEGGLASSAAEAAEAEAASALEEPFSHPMLPPPQPSLSSMGTPARSRIGNMLFGPPSAAGLTPTVLPDSAPPMGSSLCEHISRTASLPLMMGGAVVSQGVSPAIPIAIAGVGASGRARATTVHAPPSAATTSMGLSGGGGGGTSSLRPVAQSVDHSFFPPQPQPLLQVQVPQGFLQGTEAGAPATSPAQFIGSFSPGGPSFFASLPGTAAAVTTTAADTCPGSPRPQLQAGGTVDDMVLTSPNGGSAPGPSRQGPAVEDGIGDPAAALGSPGHSSGGAQGSPVVAPQSPPHAPFSPSRHGLGAIAAEGEEERGVGAGRSAAGVAHEQQEQDAEEEEEDMMDGASSLTGSSCGRRTQRRQLQYERVVAPVHAHADLHPRDATTTTTDTDGDEEFEDAVEVQHDDDDHVGYQGGRSHRRPQQQQHEEAKAEERPYGREGGGSGSGGGGYHHHGHSHDLHRCHFVGVASPEHPLSAALGMHGPAMHAGELQEQEPPYPPYHHQLHMQQHPGGVVGGEGPLGGLGSYRLADGYEDLAEDDEVLEEAEEEGGSCLLDADEGLEEDEEFGEEEEEEEHGIAARARSTAGGGGGGGAVGWGSGGAVLGTAAAASPAHFVAPYVNQQHTCINCTRPFWGSVCYCGHPANTEVVVPELLAAAVRSMVEGQAAAAVRQQAAGEPQGAGGRGEGVLLAYDDRCRAHLEELTPGSSEDQGRSHPERPERVAAIMTRLQATGLLARFERVTGREATLQELLAVHQPELVSELQAATEAAARLAAREAARHAGAALDEEGEEDLEALGLQKSPHILDCYFNASTAGCARLAAGSAADVARRVVCGAARHGAAIIRPPGHHAESGVAMGFCYYNNAAVAARAAQAAGARRVLILDWDVHHGNGTQRIFYDDPSVLYMSTHRFDNGSFYPGTGDATETGSGAGLGFTVNVPWNGSGVRDADMLAAFRHVLLPVAAEFRPDLVIVSAGFDAVEGDPLGGCRVSPAAYGHFTALLSSLAPTLLLLEGGYNLSATAAATEACLRVLLGEQPAPLQGGPGMGAPAILEAHAAPAAALADPWVAAALDGVSESAIQSLRLVLRVQSQLWQAARERHVLLEAALEERRQQQLARMQQRSPLQPQEHWGWHVQMAPLPSSQPHQHVHQLQMGEVLDSDDHCQSRLQHSLDDPASHISMPEDDGDLADQDAERPRRMDVSMSGIIDLGEQLIGDSPMG